MAIVACFHCREGLEVPLPEEGGPPYGTAIVCTQCNGEFVIYPPEDTELVPVEEVEFAEPLSYSDRMMAEQLLADEDAQYRLDVAEAQQRASLNRGQRGGGQGTVNFASATVIAAAVLCMCVVSAIGGWLVGDEVAFFMSRIVGPLIRSLTG